MSGSQACQKDSTIAEFTDPGSPFFWPVPVTD